MFDPTIFDNLKVVLEGRLYDVDAENRIRISGREDIVDLAAMSRKFCMRFARNGGTCQAAVTLASGLTDFAAERRIARLADRRPGADLLLTLDLPRERRAHCAELHDYLTRLWGEEADIRHELTVLLQPEANEGPSEAPETYRIQLKFRQRIDESHIEELEQWLDIAVMCLVYADEGRNFVQG
ncbi:MULTISPECIES: hypothetical protein [Paenibacillus]|nr:MULTISPECIES: hypothetical protein [Paenibacillus]